MLVVGGGVVLVIQGEVGRNYLARGGGRNNSWSPSVSLRPAHVTLGLSSLPLVATVMTSAGVCAWPDVSSAEGSYVQ